MQQIFFIIVSWIVREVVVKFLIIAAIYAALVLLVPMVVGFITPYISTAGLNSAFGAVPDGVYFFFYYMRLDVGLPLLISASIASFLIRRLPVVG
jgi:hypothetical protein